jgi:hypothetical protein
MTTEEAKLILQSYRPGGGDDADPFFANALGLADIDRELNCWFARQQSFDGAMSRALQSENPPAGLRDAILARKTSPQAAKPGRLLYLLPLLLSMAAAIMLFVGITFYHKASTSTIVGSNSTGMTVASFTSQVLGIKERGEISLGKSGHDPEQLRPWLAQQGAPARFVLPPGLHRMPSHGCQSYTLGGTKVTMICFAIENGQVAYLFVVDKSALKDAASRSQPEFHEVNGLAFATWTSGDTSYVLTGDNISRETLQKLI